MKRGLTLISGALLICIHANAHAEIGPFGLQQEKMVMTNLSSMPLAFTENRGQWDEKVLYRAEAGGATFYFCHDEVVYFFVRDTDELEEEQLSWTRRKESLPDAPPFERPRYKKEAMLIKAEFIGANPNPEIIPEDRLSHNCNYFYGNDPAKWRTDVPSYSAITYKDIWPGIDLRYYGTGRGMKYDFIVNPGAEISLIKVHYDGADDLAVTPNGDLQADTRFGFVYENIPSVYQEMGGTRHNITGRYRIVEPGVFGFEVEGYNHSVALVIDPELVYSTYIGGSSNEEGFGIAVDGSGSAYVTGFTRSFDFPTANPYDGSYNETNDVIVTKLSAAGNSLLYSTYLGGHNRDRGHGIAVDGSGSAYVTGETHSWEFPTVNPYDESFNGYYDVFVTKLSAAGNSLLYSTFLGGDMDDRGYGIAIDGSGSAYVTGETSSSDFPMVNSYDGSHNGYYDVFVARLSAAGNSLLYSTYLGGPDEEEGRDIAVDGSGSAYVTGYTRSSEFPVVNPYDGSYSNTSDAFVTKLSATGNSLLYSTYLGAGNPDYGCGIAVDGSGSAYVTGYTYSFNFPTVNPYDGSHNGLYDVFVTRLSAAGNSLLYSTFLGGSSSDFGLGIAVDGSGSAYVTGFTESSNFPTVNAYDGSFNGYYDVFVARLSAAGNSLLYSTYLGGTYIDEALGITVDDSGSAYVTGYTYSSDFPTVNPYDGSFNGYIDVLVAKFAPASCDYFPGDVNQNGVPLEMNDVVAMIGNYRGSIGVLYRCDCGVDPPGWDFAATADPNGNCVANELTDVVTEIAAYRGLGDVSGCPDCPGSGR
jgi:hypothetical protein